MEGPPHARETWWNRPCGVREVLAISLPLVVSLASWTVMNFTDRMFLLWHSSDEMASSLPAGMLLFAIACFPLGLASYANTFVAQYHGAGRPERIGAAVGQAIWIGVVSAPLLLLFVPLAPWIFSGIAQHTGEVARLETSYFRVLAFGAGALVLAGAQSTFFTGRGRTVVVMVVDSSASALNVVLDYLWIFGLAGFPEWGIEGAGWATVVSQWTKVGIYAALMARPALRRQYNLVAGLRFDRALMRRMLRFGTPAGLQLLLDVTAFTMFVFLAGWIGKDAIAATTLAFNVNSVAFVPMFGLGIGITTLVGQQLGHNRPDLAARATWTGWILGLLYTGALGIWYVAAPDFFLAGYAAGADPAEFGAVRNLTVVLLRFVAVYCLLDATAVMFASAIKGAGDTRFVLIVTLFSAPLPVLGSWLGVHFFEQGILWCWTVLTLWLSAQGVIYFARFLQGRWRTMRVIEPETALPDLEQEPAAALSVLATESEG